MKTIKLLAAPLAAIETIMGAVSATATTTIVHDAARDMVLNQANSPVYTNVYGGVWTYMRADSNTDTRYVLTGGKQGDAKYNGFSTTFQRGPKDANKDNPWFSVNPTAWDDNTENQRGNGLPAIPPGGISCHPGPLSGGYRCAVARFTVPRSGTYEVIAKAWNQNIGKRGVSLLVNGTVRSGRTTWGNKQTSQPYAVITNDFSLAAATYAAGDIIELAVDGDNSYDSNATGFEFKIVETVPDAVDAAASFRANQSSGSPSNPFSDAFGSWSALWTDGLVTENTRSAMDLACSATTTFGTQISGWRTSSVRSGEGDAGNIRVNMADAMVVCTGSNGEPTTTSGRAYLPLEFASHPRDHDSIDNDKTYRANVLRVLPTEGGIYDIGVSARDMKLGDTPNSDIGTHGVNVRLLNGGRVLGTMRIAGEGWKIGVPASGTIFAPAQHVAPGIPVEVAIDNAGQYWNDETGFVLAFVKRDIPGTSYSANAAMIANERSASPVNPFTYGGATWTAGYCSDGWSGEFTPYTTHVTAQVLPGWWASVNNTENPKLFANVAGRILSGSETGNQLPLGEGALMGHPNNNPVRTTAIRFTAPADGVYAASVWATDIAYKTQGQDADDNGVDVHVVVGERSLDSAVVNANPANSGVARQAVVGKDLIYLRANDTVSFVVDRNGTWNWDSTEIYAWVDQDAVTASQILLSIDLNATEAAVYRGAGRLGYADSIWNKMVVPNGAASIESRQLRVSDGSGHAGAKLTVSKAGGISATASGTATDTRATALFGDGIVSTGTTDITAWEFTGLLPDTDYELFLFSRAKSGDDVVNGVFASGGAEVTSTESWFADAGGDYAVLSVRSDAQGVVSGTFRSASEAAAVWAGVQILGPGYAEHIPDSTTVILR